MTGDLWTTAQCAEHFGVEVGSAYSTLYRLGIRPVARQPGRGGQNLYDAEQVRTASRPGQGKRTDLRTGDRS